MKSGRIALFTGLWVSLMIHGAVICGFLMIPPGQVPEKKVTRSMLVPVTMREPEPKITVPEKPAPPKPKPVPQKKTPVKVAKKTAPEVAPVSHMRSQTQPPAKAEAVKPVFGVSRKTVTEPKPGAGSMAMRMGNTLMKEQEDAFTPPEKVRNYVTVPLFELSTMPAFRKRVTPEYPADLKKQELQGEVSLSVTIDVTGHVVDIRVLRSSHALFARAAMAAVKHSLFIPATRNGSPVATILDDLVYSFVLDD